MATPTKNLPNSVTSFFGRRQAPNTYATGIKATPDQLLQNVRNAPMQARPQGVPSRVQNNTAQRAPLPTPSLNSGRNVLGNAQRNRQPLATIPEESTRENLAQLRSISSDRQRDGSNAHAGIARPEQARALAPFSASALLNFPPLLQNNLTDLNRQSTMPKGVVAQAWQCLTANTGYLKDHWRFIDNARPIPSANGERPALRRAREVVLNRFTNIRLVQASAIQDPVRSRGAQTPHYLHANQVNLGCGRNFIAAQKPVSQEIAGFHQMLVQRKVGLVVDLTKPRERKAATDYFPQQKGKRLRAAGSNVIAFCTRREKEKPLMAISQNLQMRGAEGAHSMQRLHFLGWPDHGVISSKQLIALADKVEAMSPDPSRPVLIHCMAGVGRTGTLMSFIGARKKIADEVARNNGACNAGIILRIALETVAQGRVDRSPSFVQTPEQFERLVEALTHNFAGALATPGVTAPKTAAPLATSHTSPTSTNLPSPPKGTAFVAATKQGKPATLPTAPKAPRVRFNAIEASVQKIWHQLSRLTASLRYTPANVYSNNPTIICPAHTGLKVRVGKRAKASQRAFHANAIAFPTNQARTALAGQSPQSFDLCENFLLHGLDSRRGLFQFISPNANANPAASRENPMMAQLQQRWEAANQSGESLVLGGRYIVTGVDALAHDADDYRQMRLTTIDLENPAVPAVITLTQAGMKFDDNVLRASEIARADTLTQSHLDAGRHDTPAQASDPMIVSYTGIGRNATLICFREAVARLNTVQDEAEIDALLEEIVAQGRRDRGPYFVHSALQLNELKQAVVAQFREQRPVADNVSQAA